MVLKTLDAEELFNVSKEIRIKAINEGIDLFLKQCEQIAELLNEPYDKVIEITLSKFQAQLDMELINENYELCYYLQAIINGVNKKLQIK